MLLLILSIFFRFNLTQEKRIEKRLSERELQSRRCSLPDIIQIIIYLEIFINFKLAAELGNRRMNVSYVEWACSLCMKISTLKLIDDEIDCVWPGLLGCLM